MHPNCNHETLRPVECGGKAQRRRRFADTLQKTTRSFPLPQIRTQQSPFADPARAQSKSMILENRIRINQVHCGKARRDPEERIHDAKEQPGPHTPPPGRRCLEVRQKPLSPLPHRFGNPADNRLQLIDRKAVQKKMRHHQIDIPSGWFPAPHILLNKSHSCLREPAPMEPLTRPLLKSKGLAGSRILTEWPSIVGNELAAHCLPEKLTFPPAKKVGGTLTISVESGFATHVQYMQPVILEKLATYFGYKAVERINISHTHTPAKPHEKPARKATVLQKEAVQAVEGVEDAELREALQSFAKTLSGDDH